MSNQRKKRYEDIMKRMQLIGAPITIVSLMDKLGFWKGEKSPFSPDDEKKLKELEEINKEIQDIENMAINRWMYKDVRKKVLKQRLEESKRNMKLKRQAKIEKRDKKREANAIRLKEGLWSVGKEYSRNLNQKSPDINKLKQFNLPVIQTWKELASFLGIPEATLKRLTYHREVVKYDLYHEFEIPKKTGGKRKISAPIKILKTVQRTILDKILYNLQPSESAHGFTKDRSILTNANCHLYSAVVINFDLKDFFPSIKFGRVFRLFRYFGYSGEVATLLALLCTTCDRLNVKIGDKHFLVANSVRNLPQGAPTSPMISNLIAYRLDKRLKRFAMIHGVNYSRYADDITISIPKSNISPEAMNEKIGKIKGMLKRVIVSEGFMYNTKKIHILRIKSRMEVTGLLVNEPKAHIPKSYLKTVRAILYNINKNGFKAEAKSDDIKHFICSIYGKIMFIQSIMPDKAKKHLDQWHSAIMKWKEEVIEANCEFFIEKAEGK